MMHSICELTSLASQFQQKESALGVLLLSLDEMPVHRRISSMKRLGVFSLSLEWDASPSMAPSMMQLGVLLLPLDEMPVHRRIPSMKRLGVFSLSLEWDASPSQATQHEATSSITTPPE